MVYNRFPILKVDEDRRWERREFLERGEDEDQASSASEGIGSGWAVFVAMPIFYGEFSINDQNER